MLVPKNKKVYVGKRKFKDGDFLPSYVIQKHDINFEEKKAKKKTSNSGSYKSKNY